MKFKTILFTVLTFLGAVHVVGNAQSSALQSSKQTMTAVGTFDTIKLQTPDKQGGKPLMSVLKNRKSDREFTAENLSVKHLSEILWAANGINRENGKRTVPSAMALYPIQVYAVMANGTCFYNPHKHVLEPVVKGDYRKLAGLQDYV
ncbi:MAG: nitroreductase family protein, partial [Paludibacter sp.]|nr:nitroreductase family protein [Paludibacter sp.]